MPVPGPLSDHGRVRPAEHRRRAQPDYDDPLELIQVKRSNESSEDFDLLLSSAHIRRGGGSYRQTCTPASFPVDLGSHVLDSTPIVGPDVLYCQVCAENGACGEVVVER